LDDYLPGMRPPLESQLIDLADEIAYDGADLDDGFAAGLFKARDVAEHVPAYAELFETIETQFPGADEHDQFQEILRLLMDWMVSGLITGTTKAAKASGARDSWEVREVKTRIAAFTPEAQQASRDLKTFMLKFVFSNEQLAADRRRSRTMIGELFQFFLEHPEKLPEWHASRAVGQRAPRVVCDYIAGMTDVFFRRTYEAAIGQR
jgi:dGTPase